MENINLCLMGIFFSPQKPGKVTHSRLLLTTCFPIPKTQPTLPDSLAGDLRWNVPQAPAALALCWGSLWSWTRHDKEKITTHPCFMEGEHGIKGCIYRLHHICLLLFLYWMAQRAAPSRFHKVPLLDTCFNLRFPHSVGNNILMFKEKERLICHKQDNCCKT